MFVGVNPLHEDPLDDVEDIEIESQPLLRRMKKMESTVEQEGRAVRAKMDNVETKVDHVETKVDHVETKISEEIRLLKSQISALEQDNKALRKGSIMASSHPDLSP